MKTKVCTKCKVEKPFSEYYKKAGRKYGLDSRCKECFKAPYREKRKKARKKKEKFEKEILLKKKKICTKCGVEKSFDDFFKNKNKKFGIDSWCKECSSLDTAKRQENYRKKYPEKVALAKKRRRVKNEYGISLNEYEQRINGSCDICGERKKQMNLDHCHTTGKLRGCLCSSCNNGLGRFKDNPKLFTNALMYLNRYK